MDAVKWDDTGTFGKSKAGEFRLVDLGPGVKIEFRLVKTERDPNEARDLERLLQARFHHKSHAMLACEEAAKLLCTRCAEAGETVDQATEDYKERLRRWEASKPVFNQPREPEHEQAERNARPERSWRSTEKNRESDAEIDGQNNARSAAAPRRTAEQRGPGRKDAKAPPRAAAKRGPGRPRKEEPKPAAKRGPGRPRKEPEPAAAKRGPGRPRKEPEPEPTAAKRGPGRPRKEPQPAVAAGPRMPAKRGRPPKAAAASTADMDQQLLNAILSQKLDDV